MRLGLTILLLIVASPCLRATVINWTNTQGGNWSVASNWDLHRAPSSSDDIAIIAGGNYTVALDTNTGGVSLALGGGNGSQTLLATNNQVYNIRKINVGASGVLSLAGSGGSFYFFEGALTNAGAVLITGEILNLTSTSPTNGIFVNLPGGLVNLLDDSSIYANNNTEILINQGTLRKSGGAVGSNQSGTTLNASLINSGLLDVQIGTVRLNNNYNLASGIVNFGIISSAKYGTLILGGNPARINGAVGITLKNGYLPPNQTVFTAVNFNSFTNAFSNFYFPSNALFRPVYYSNSVAFQVTNLVPTLSIAESNNAANPGNSGIYLSYPSVCTGYVLQQAAALSSTHWINSQLPVTDNGTNRSFFLNPTSTGATNVFFRLMLGTNP